MSEGQSARRRRKAEHNGETALYDRIGTTYSVTRAADPRIAGAIRAALGDARSVLNVGAGAGAYEPTDLEVLAVEPSAAMIAQRPPGSAPALRGSAESLPVADRSFDAALAVNTVHHWDDLAAGLRELRRVARKRIVIFRRDGQRGTPLWLVERYLPVLAEPRKSAAIAETIERELGPVTEIPIAHSLVTAPTGSSARTGRGPRRTSTATSAGTSRTSLWHPSGSSPRGSSASRQTSNRANGIAATGTYVRCPSSTSATASSSQRARFRPNRRPRSPDSCVRFAGDTRRGVENVLANGGQRRPCVIRRRARPPALGSGERPGERLENYLQIGYFQLGVTDPPPYQIHPAHRYFDTAVRAAPRNSAGSDARA